MDLKSAYLPMGLITNLRGPRRFWPAPQLRPRKLRADNPGTLFCVQFRMKAGYRGHLYLRILSRLNDDRYWLGAGTYAPYFDNTALDFVMRFPRAGE